MKSKTQKIVLSVFVIGALLISVNAIFFAMNNKENDNTTSYLIGGGGFIVSAILLFFIFKSKNLESKLPFPEIVEKYKEYMEKGFRITVPQDVLVYYMEEVEDKYIAVLTEFSSDEAKNIYYPFEANKFTAEFGRGSGQTFKNILDTEFWINKYDKTYQTGKNIAKMMGEDIAKKIREETEFRKRSSEDNEGEGRDER